MRDKNHDSSRRIASVSAVLSNEAIEALAKEWGLATVTAAIRAIQEHARQEEFLPSWSVDPSCYAPQVEGWLARNRVCAYQRVFNLSGTILHTNLGRACLDPSAIDAVVQAAQRPVALEFDLVNEGRGDRERPVRERLCQMFGAEDATIVNNNAAAVLLILNTLARNAKVLVSRGELIEIGGSFRLPEIMERSGCHLVEVGTTNRTRMSDYASRIDEATALLFKAHPSNFRIRGFTEDADVSELAALSQQSGVPLAVDLGSASPMNLSRFGLSEEISASAIVKMNALVSFSGDKILGGPQCGIILGSARLIGQLNANPLKRALRTDKLSLAAVNATLRTLENPGLAVESIPFLRTLNTPDSVLIERGRKVAKALARKLPKHEVQVERSETQVGSGAHPDETIPSYSVVVDCGNDRSVRYLTNTFRHFIPPIIGRLHRHRLCLDMRGADDLDDLLATINEGLK